MIHLFQNYPGLVAVFSLKEDGSMRLAMGAGPDEKIRNNRRKFFEKVSVADAHVAVAKLDHTANIRVVRAEDKNEFFDDTDGLITDEKNVFLTVTTADCLPVYFYDSIQEAVGLAHAGWKGLSGSILAAMIEKFRTEFSSDPANIAAAIGPGICGNHYEVNKERAAHFGQGELKDALRPSGLRPGRFLLDLKKIARNQLMGLGLGKESIEVYPDCTYEYAEKYFSYRREGPDTIEAMMALIGMRQ